MASSDTPQSRLSTRLAFWVAGFAVSCWAPLVPFAKQRLAVDDSTLGLLLLCLGIGSVAAMLRTGPLCARYGCKPVIISGGMGLVVLLPALAVVDTPLLLALVLFGFGGALGSLDVAMNVQAVEVERDAKRPLMSGFHALFSVGGFAGAALMTFLLSLSLSPLAGTLICSTLMLVAMVVTAPRLLVTAKTSEGALLVIPRGPVLLIAALAAVMFLVEGALLDWSALLLTDTGLVGAAQAGIGYAVFSVAMTAGRFGGDAITARFGDLKVMVWGGLVGIGGFAVLLLAPHMGMAMAGFLLIGFGASNIVPVLFRRAGAQRAMPAALAIAAITTTGYAGHLMGPATVGLVSKSVGLPGAFWVLAGLMCLVPVFAWTVTGEPASDGVSVEVP
ncbi:MFS transporter [Piscinibacter terrae]|uniref:MFS transporter n=1 Tax=Piscinibacter terrae TaxID=2496871 RepID=A0A3N7HV89_9BURK|nr:MFS transporter [Albitalea terrae]RQP25266.1 MFS transporter [Albitalea terrae]